MKLNLMCFSFAARILRAIRIAARLDFQFSRDTARAIQDCSLSILRIEKVLTENYDSPVYALSILLLFHIHSVCLLLIISGKADDGNELYAGIWSSRGFSAFALEIWTS
jgi:hypothetical protein